MKNSYLLLNSIFIFARIADGTDLNDSCGGNGWIAYENEKCFKLIEENTTGSEAAYVCDRFVSTVASINTSAEQDFLIKYVFNASITNNIWIDRPSIAGELGKSCVSFHANKNEIEWMDVGCATENWVLCQRLQTFSLEELQRIILRANKELQELRRVTSQLTLDLNVVNQKMDVLLAYPVPVGFIYTQLPGQGDPYDIWGFTMWWLEITTEYAGLFFRVLGGGSAQFNVTQAENNNRLTNVNTAHTINTWSIAVPPTGAYSDVVASGEMGSGSTTAWGLRFAVSGGEVRPRNTAVRIWKRIH